MDHQAKEEEDNQDQVMLPAEKFHRLSELSKYLAANGDSPSSVTLEGEETDFLDQACNCTDLDDSVVWVLKELGTK